MKRLTAILLLFVFLSSNTEIHQFFKLPVLVHHFLADHHEQDVNFSQFIGDHYSANSEHSNNAHHEHDNLPFKSANCSATHATSVFVNQIEYAVLFPLTYKEKVTPIHSSVFYSSTVVNTIWQPPQYS